MLAQSSLVQRGPADLMNSPSLKKPNGSSSKGGKSGHDSNYQIKRNADQMLRQNHASGLHDLLLEQITRSETLMSDNALM